MKTYLLTLVANGGVHYEYVKAPSLKHVTEYGESQVKNYGCFHHTIEEVVKPEVLRSRDTYVELKL